MKKTILAVAIPALFAASAQAANVYDADGVSADVYGRMQFQIMDDGTDTDGVGSARMGFNVSSVIAPGVSAIAKGEWQIAAENSGEDDEQFNARHLYAGFDFDDAGSVTFGQSDTAFYYAVAPTDIFNGEVGYEAFNIIESGRQEGQIMYAGEFGGFVLNASYQFRNDDFMLGKGSPNAGFPSVKTNLKLDNSYAATIGYNFDFGLGIYGGYHAEDFEVGEKKSWAISAAYSWEDLYLAAVYTQADLDDLSILSDGVVYEPSELTGYDIVLSYDFADAATFYTGYAAQEAEGKVDGTAAKGDTADAFKLGLQYAFNSNMKAWAEYKVDGLEGADDYWEMAIQYNF